MRIIDADALMPLFMKKANTMKDRHGVKLGEEWLLNYNDIKDVIDNAPTIETDMSEYSDKLWKLAYERGKAEERPQGEWIVDEDAFSKDFRKCSNCNEDAEWLEGGCQFLPNFCPNCGAKMTKEAENEI